MRIFETRSLSALVILADGACSLVLSIVLLLGFRLLRRVPAFNAPLSTSTTSGSFQPITPLSIRFNTAAACSDGVGVIAEANPEMTFLEKMEIATLLKAVTGDDLLVALLGLSTGGRWTEIATLKPTQVINCRVTFLKTKNGKKRTVPISAELEKMIKEKASGKLFKVDYEKFCKILRMVKPDIPPNQATHILRHTFASHFMMNGGNIIALQQILGHASIQQTMVYAHLSPDYLQNAVALNPLAGGTSL